MEDFLSHYAAVSSADGSYVKLYLQQHTGEILEGTWYKHAQQWVFKQIMDAGVAALPTPLAAAMSPDDHIRLFFVDDEMVIQEFEIVNGEASIGSFCTVNAKLPEVAGLSAVPNYSGREQFRLYHPGEDGYLQNYGLNGGSWERPAGIASQIDLQSPICSVNSNPSDWGVPCIKTFYRNRSSELKVLEWNGSANGLRVETTPFYSLPESAKFAAAYTEARGSGSDNISTPAKVMLFVVEDGQLMVCGKNGSSSWSPPLAVSIERDGTNIAAVSAREGDGTNDVHVFTSEEEGQFVHRILRDGEWEDSVINPTELLANPVAVPILIPEMRLGAGGRGDFRIGPGSGNNTDSKTNPAVHRDEIGGISFVESLKDAGLTLGSLGETDKQFSHIQIPHDEDHEHIVLPKLTQATYEDSMDRLTFFYRAAIDQTSSLHKASLIDSDLPGFLSLSIMKLRYRWSNPRQDYYPPHLDQGVFRNILDIFNFGGIFKSDYLTPIVELFAKSVPWSFSEGLTGSGAPWLFDRSKPVTMASIQSATKQLHNSNNGKGRGIYTKDTIGDDPHWFTDEKFAQQHFSGTNPTTIRAASNNWVGSFVRTAKAQRINGFERQVMAVRKNLFVQDYSYFRASIGQKGSYDLSYTSTLQDRFTDLHGLFFHERYACASVVLFELHDDGHLHPLAIVLDYKEDDIKLQGHRYEKTSSAAMQNSVVIFNKKISPSQRHDEEHDWPWRYAKMCAQVSDWHRHEIAIHLVNTHLVEEAAIVAMMRTVEEKHVVYRLLKPHWVKTLPLNHAARLILMPAIIKPIAGFRPSDLNKFTMDAYKNFYWEDLYIPNDLKLRGFPNKESDLNANKYRNYSYAKNMVVMWDIIHTFVGKVLNDHYKNDDAVRNDTEIQAWVQEMQSDHGAQQKHFPDIKSRESLINVVTMCIHIASPQHTAVNYMQEYYQTFVPNKPPSFFKPIPKTTDELKDVKEDFIISSLPFVPPSFNLLKPLKNTVGVGNVWLLAAHLPHLLSEEVHAPLDMSSYSDQAVDIERRSGTPGSIKAAEEFRTRIKGLTKVFDAHSGKMTVKVTPSGYSVMNPEKMAVSILI
ncbi:hypothetical protein TWF225_004204 [Orbilia oligospora]|uniref:Manganese lipoxygenase n=1 Tax=Orbilia oligospora TaxID=2813651 RepID=A0A7C8KKU8_ORBOL|nr:hypothetical protein TWF751_006724 [Orbilia oligospora]KAF3187497.1 hypothetical protein TWF225_004204 [Orbilia oligospora]KAF3267243.1 hypothetical protein TWF128_010178 [Orbilia oligospora]KAF3272798.1 hypothetical protein TWF217_000260 [Orbilia oligospora]TGJ64766.1 hypothetical protein EYR41_010802 [Orbilia oligospora]